MFMRKAKDRNLTVRLPVALLRQLKARSAAEGVSMNAYLERVLATSLSEGQSEFQRIALSRILELSREGLYRMDQPLTREEAHARR